MADIIICVATNLFRIYLLSRIIHIFYLYNMLSDAFSHQYENVILRQAIQGYSNQLDIMLQGEEKVKALRHDIKRHMNEIKILAAKNENRAIEKYIDDMREFIKNKLKKEMKECPCCGYLKIDDSKEIITDICDVCVWQYDEAANEEPDRIIGANKVSLNTARDNFKAFGAVEERFITMVCAPYDDGISVTDGNHSGGDAAK